MSKSGTCEILLCVSACVFPEGCIQHKRRLYKTLSPSKTVAFDFSCAVAECSSIGEWLRAIAFSIERQRPQRVSDEGSEARRYHKRNDLKRRSEKKKEAIMRE